MLLEPPATYRNKRDYLAALEHAGMLRRMSKSVDPTWEPARPAARITAITMCENPISYTFLSQMPPSESEVLQSLANAGVLLKQLHDGFEERNVHDVYIDRTFGGSLGHAIIAMSSRYGGQLKRIGRLVADISNVKRVTLVDHDVDIRDPSHVEWALNERFDPASDTVIVDGIKGPWIPPSARPTAYSGMASKLLLDATQKVDAGTFSLRRGRL